VETGREEGGEREVWRERRGGSVHVLLGREGRGERAYATERGEERRKESICY
jgi:hypothetical protein